MPEEVTVVLEFLHPGPYLPDVCAGDRGDKPAELITVERAQVVGEIRCLATVHEPVKRSPENVSAVTRHDHGTEGKCRASGRKRMGQAVPKFRLHCSSSPWNLWSLRAREVSKV